MVFMVSLKPCTKSVHGMQTFSKLEVIIIGAIVRSNFISEEYERSSHYEYSSCIELDSISGNYFVIPSSVILDTSMNEKRATIFSFFSMYRGLNNNLFFSINNIARWMGKQPNRNANGINGKVIQIIEQLNRLGYLTLFDELSNSSIIEANFDLSKISQECELNRFAVIYIDEINRILKYKNSNSKDSFLNNDIILLIFAYLRMKIFRRRNKLFPEEINIDNKNNHQYDIEIRKFRSPDAYDCYFYEIAEELGISARTVSKAIDVLNELELIYHESLPRVKHGNKWHTDHTVFCNFYKRESNYLLANGSSYYLAEIENKKKKIGIQKGGNNL